MDHSSMDVSVHTSFFRGPHIHGLDGALWRSASETGQTLKNTHPSFEYFFGSLKNIIRSKAQEDMDLMYRGRLQVVSKDTDCDDKKRQGINEKNGQRTF